ncbi:MAG: antibiotic biosynthesis monooxygenase [Porticoccus sp.]|nr:antibiotic biosynthesis monooxygenase [Porticoccus sp.]MBQ0807293.1 antibiotic biosynthesis monooxygenase [Porticoccus sp.]MDX2350511.1 antibiotic biosynthesis monooxygenase [Porticoccus sp.]
MYLAMNRFQVNEGREDDFIEVWRSRDSFLNEVPGFKSFNLLRGKTEDGITPFVSHSVWESRAVFEDWTRSEAFRKAHAGAGKTSEGIYAGPPKLELLEAVL